MAIGAPNIASPKDSPANDPPATRAGAVNAPKPPVPVATAPANKPPNAPPPNVSPVLVIVSQKPLSSLTLLAKVTAAPTSGKYVVKPFNYFKYDKLLDKPPGGN